MATSKKLAAAPATGERKSSAQSMSNYERIAALAYFKAEARGFYPGHELDDWLEAEREINNKSATPKKH